MHSPALPITEKCQKFLLRHSFIQEFSLYDFENGREVVTQNLKPSKKQDHEGVVKYFFFHLRPQKLWKTNKLEIQGREDSQPETLTKRCDFIPNLPVEVASLIFCQLSFDEVCIYSRVSKIWYSLVCGNQIWRGLYSKHYGRLPPLSSPALSSFSLETKPVQPRSKDQFKNRYVRGETTPILPGRALVWNGRSYRVITSDKCMIFAKYEQNTLIAFLAHTHLIIGVFNVIPHRARPPLESLFEELCEEGY